MELTAAVAEVMLGASMRAIADAHRQELLDAFGFRPEETDASVLVPETMQFMRELCRHLGDRHAGDPRALVALHDWVQRVDHYEAFDALLSGFRFEGRERLVRRGRMLFPGPLTAHWTEVP
jgi:hypothetical protein